MHLIRKLRYLKTAILPFSIESYSRTSGRRLEETRQRSSPLVQEGVNTERAAARLLYRCNFSANAECRYSKDYTVSAATPGLSRRDGVSAIVGATTRGDGDRLSWPVNFRTGFAATRHHFDPSRLLRFPAAFRNRR